MTTTVPTRKQHPLWEEFLRLSFPSPFEDPREDETVRRFIRTHKIVNWIVEKERGHVQDPDWTPGESDFISQHSLRGYHLAFSQQAEALFNWQNLRSEQQMRLMPRGAEAVRLFGAELPPAVNKESNQAQGRAQLEAALDYFGGQLAELHPTFVMEKDGSLRLRMPDSGAVPYGILPRIALGFAQDFARGIVARCPYCKNLFALTPKQIAKLKEPGRRAYCSDACRVAFIESSEERRAQKVAAAKQSRENARRKRKSRKRKGGGE